MELLSFRFITYQPKWRKQIEDEFTVFTLPVSLLGITIIQWFIPIYFNSFFSKELLEGTDRKTNIVIATLANPSYALLLGIILSALVVLLIIRMSIVFYDVSFTDEWNKLLVKASDQFISEQGEDFSEEITKADIQKIVRIDLFKVFLLSIIEGLYFATIFFLPIYILFVVLTFVFIVLVSFSLALTLALFSSWLIFTYHIISKRLIVEEPKQIDIDPYQDYDLQQKDIDIILSNQPPIICPGCRSYISAASKICSICGEELIMM